jgi:hypothetical protein
MTLMCAVCGHAAEPAAHIATVAVCASCGASNAIAIDGTVTRATAADTASLSARDLVTLTQARRQIAKATRHR